MPGKLHTVMINPAEGKVHFFMENLPDKVTSIDIPPGLFPCRLGILAFMHQTIEIVNDLHPPAFYDKIAKMSENPSQTRTRSGGAAGHSEYAQFLATEVPCFKTQKAHLLEELCKSQGPKKEISKGEAIQFSESEKLSLWHWSISDDMTIIASYKPRFSEVR